MEKINLNDFDLVVPNSIEILDVKNEKFIDINVEDDHTFFVHLNENNIDVLSHNCDGAHITELYIGFFTKYCPSLINEGRIKKLITPIICMKDKSGNIIEFFFNFENYNNWLKNNPNTKLKTHYYKGLGSWKSNELRELVNKFGLDYFIQTLEFDENSIGIIDDWLNKKKADTRKEFLKKNEFSIFGI